MVTNRASSLSRWAWHGCCPEVPTRESLPCRQSSTQAWRGQEARDFPGATSQVRLSMFKIVQTRWLGPGVKRLEVQAPRIAAKQKPGQFVIVRVHDHGERIPLTIAASDVDAGTISLIVQGIGKTTRLINMLGAGDSLLDVAGPLGLPSHIDKFGSVVVIGGGVGAAIAWPTARALKQAGNHVVTILGARTSELVLLQEELSACSDQLLITTDDGSLGRKGLVTDVLKELLVGEQPPDFVLAIGPIPMMRGVAEVTRPFNVPTVVSLNSIMVDGTGMCGGCRVSVGGAAKFACVDGPEFDAHQVDFGVLAARASAYREAEQEALARFERNSSADLDRVQHQCRLTQQHPELGRNSVSHE